MESMNYDAVIIGGGVTGCAVARELSRYELSVCVLEKEEDVCSGTSKANSAIAHAGHDATPGSLKAKFNVQGSQMMEPLSKELDFDYVRNGIIHRDSSSFLCRVWGRFWSFCSSARSLNPVSYTHLDVYKRQVHRLYGV